MKRIRLTGYFSFLVNGMLAVMTGTIISYLVSDYGITYTAAGRMVAAQSIGNLVMVFLSGFIIQLIGRKKSLLLFPLLFAVGFGGIALTGNPAVLYVLFVLTGLGWGLCNNILNIIIMEDSEGGGISVLYTCYAIGSFLGPFFVVLVTGLGLSWKIAVLVVAFASILAFAGFLGAKGKAVESQNEKREPLTGKDFKFLTNVRYYVCLLLYFGYIGVEVSINSWIVTYLSETGLLPLKLAETMFSVYWLIIIFVRIFTGAFLKKMKREILLTIQWIGFAAGLTMLIFADRGIAGIIIMVVMALFMGAISPVNAENADEFIKGKGISGGIMFAVGCAGSAILPMVVGKLTDSTGISAGMKAVAIVMYVMVGVCIVNIFIKRKKQK